MPGIPGFLPQASPTPTTDLDHARAATLAAIIRHHLPGTRINTATWAEHFRLLRVSDEAGEEVEAVLEWYGRAFGRQYTPQVISARAFRAKYHALRVARAAAPKPRHITHDAEQVAAYLLPLGWPDDLVGGLAGIAQGVLDTYTGFRGLLRDARGLPRGIVFFGVVLGQTLPDPVTFAQQWLTDARAYWSQRHGWDHNPATLAWTPAHPVFRRQMRDLSAQCLGNESGWDRLAAVLGCE